MAGSGITHNDLSILDDMSHVVGLRGMDGSGIVQGLIPLNFREGDNIRDLIVAKSKWDIPYFKKWNRVHKEGNRELFEGISNNFFMVHARAATVGGINDENAHPFETGRYIGMHNGSLVSQEYLVPGRTDSEMMFQAMEEKGIEPVLRSLSVNDAFAVVILDKLKGEIYFVNNGRRPFHVGFHQSRSVMYWASEDWMVREMVTRQKQKLKNNDVWIMTPGVVYKFRPSLVPKDIDGFTRYPLLTEKKVETPPEEDKKDVRSFEYPQYPRGRKNKKERKSKSLRYFRDTPPTDDKSNIIPFPKGGKIPETLCSLCNGSLSLSEAYFAKQYGRDVICVTCDDATTPSVSIH